MGDNLDEKQKVLGEAIIDTIDAAKVELVESIDEASGEKKIMVRGEFGRADKPTANKRLYPHGLWESQIKRLSGHLGSRKMLGELDHPTDGRTSLKRISHVITDLKLEGDLVVGEAEILDTTLGKDLKAMLKANIPIGISSRGYGSIKSTSDGTNVVQEDYKLVTFDFVAEPADQTAYPNVFFEGAEIPAAVLIEGEQEPVEEATDAELQAKIEKIVNDGVKKDPKEAELQAKLEKIVNDGVEKPSEEDQALQTKLERIVSQGGTEVDIASLREEFKAEVIDRLVEMKGLVRKEVEAELLADPKIAGAKEALEHIKSFVRPFVLPEDVETLVQEKELEIKRLNKDIAERDLQIAQKDEMIESLAVAAKEAGYKFFLERKLSDVADSAIVRKMVGDVAQYESKEAVAEAVDTAVSEITARREAEEAEKAAKAAAEAALRDENAKLTEALEETTRAVRQQAMLLEAERALTNHPDAEKIRRVLESTALESEDQMFEIIESFRVTARAPEEVEHVRNRVRSMVGGGQSHLPETPEKTARDARRPLNESNYLGLGASVGELRKLAGV